ncbi:MAG: nucleotide exchange factor GrpE [Phycisphaerae bacterium]|nr:nucleotide exchange factor GrpE [Phycisphaerae bacterium]
MGQHKNKHGNHESESHQPAPCESCACSSAPPASAGDAVALQAERDDLLGRLQRVSADYANYQKRVHRDVEQAREFANESLLKALLPMFDDMERALAAAKAHPDDTASLVAGMQMVHDNALAAATAFGLAVIAAAGKPFDPSLHAALLQQPSGDVPPQTVLNEVQKGYTLKGRLLRPAQVIVSTSPDA